VDVACGVVSTAVIVSGRHFALGRVDSRDRFDPRFGARPVGLKHWRRRKAELFCISAAAVVLAARADLLREFSPSAADGGAHYRISNRVVTLFRSVS